MLSVKHVVKALLCCARHLFLDIIATASHVLFYVISRIGLAQGYKTFFMLNSAELEIQMPHEY